MRGKAARSLGREEDWPDAACDSGSRAEQTPRHAEEEQHSLFNVFAPIAKFGKQSPRQNVYTSKSSALRSTGATTPIGDRPLGLITSLSQPLRTTAFSLLLTAVSPASFRMLLAFPSGEKLASTPDTTNPPVTSRTERCGKA